MYFFSFKNMLDMNEQEIQTPNPQREQNYSPTSERYSPSIMYNTAEDASPDISPVMRSHTSFLPIHNKLANNSMSKSFSNMRGNLSGNLSLLNNTIQQPSFSKKNSVDS